MPGFEFDVPKDAYVNFDGASLKQQVKGLLSQGGIFTDQNFEGSNLSQFNDVIGFVFGQLLYYLNRQSNEGMFSEATLYENMNRIVRSLDYKPIGFQTSTLAFAASAEGLDKGLYSIPRYSYLQVGGIKYSFNEDITFAKTTDQDPEELEDLGEDKLLFQGEFIEHPIVLATGNENEVVFLTVDDAASIDHFNVHVYVKSAQTETWRQWRQTSSLFLNRATDPVFELRFNENRRYEVKFGNDINGQKLSNGDQVAIYYLRSDGEKGEVAAGVLSGKRLIKYDTLRMRSILSDTTTDRFNILGNTNSLSFQNACTSSSSAREETVESIRKNAPGVFRSQYRVTTPGDYEVFVRTNFGNLVHDVKVVNNTGFLDGYIKYFYDLGLTSPHHEGRALLNQVRHADSCNFNNVFVFTVPRTISGSLTYLAPAQKELIIDTIRQEQVLTSETIVLDPVYLAFDLALGSSGKTLITDRDYTKILVEKDSNSRRNDDGIKEDIADVFETFFLRKNLTLGATINVNQLTADILSIPGIKRFYTVRTDINTRVEGIRMIGWNAAYGDPSLIPVVTNVTLEDFQFPYLATDIDLASRILIDNRTTIYEGVEG